ncbi:MULTISPECIES: ferrous iron transport protein B [Clostridium]|uniref:Ferrous iron transport protein B n=1 Tax=Clostridium haemolyticum NCTC 9693 TaxID=1443114 RepID=A0ABR4TF32_CLOHA|nr:MULTISPECIES: ferrous iron transport protein B [Clostridium]KEI13809.1 iron transporter FeoB [Clostridium novyi B str. NCTC 9691]KEI16505.1 iron transporter FeoB [Clostridium haemolyticum NCTC 9693]KGN04351.1 iron transporter FeoB [Clostridium haemolyticum NCTC 8350]
MLTVALVGNPNVGKTTLFNALTGSNQYVGNWAGVTVERKEGFLNKCIKIVDLPGIYAMDTYSNEEKVSKDFLLAGNADVIINIVDASNLDRNLYLTTQLRQFNKPIIIVLNMIDVAESKGINIDVEKLKNELGANDIFPMSASKGQGLNNLKDSLLTAQNSGIIIDNDFNYPEFNTEKETYSYIEFILNKCITKSSKDTISIKDKIDKILLNKFIAYPIFISIMLIIFKFTFTWVGQPLSDLLDKMLNEQLIPFLNSLLSINSPWFRSLLVDGIVGGVGSILVFLPIILTLFLGISLLEDSGYMSRVAFLMDKLMRKMGLSGKAFIPMLVGFGCSVPAIMSARTLESEKDRKLAALLVPLMSCNARLPVYALFTSVFFPGRQFEIVCSLYILGIVIAFIIGLLFKNTLFKKDEEPFIIELPEYKLPEPKNLLLHTWDKGKGFIKKAGTIILSISILVWILSNFNFLGLTEINNSFLAYIGKALTPIFKPLGFGNWQSSVSLLAGLMAKEVVVSTMEVIFGGNLQILLPQYFTTVSAYAFLAFTLLYTPCITTIGTMKKEFGNKMTIFSVVYQLILAWVVAFLVYNIGNFIM